MGSAGVWPDAANGKARDRARTAPVIRLRQHGCVPLVPLSNDTVIEILVPLFTLTPSPLAFGPLWLGSRLGGHPVMRQKFADPHDGMVRDAGENVLEPGGGIDSHAQT